MNKILFKKRRDFALRKKNSIILTGLVAYSYFVFRDTARNWAITWKLQQWNYEYSNLALNCSSSCDVIIQYKKNCTFPKLILKFKINLCLLHISNPRFHLQEDGCIYSYILPVYNTLSTCKTDHTDACKSTIL